MGKAYAFESRNAGTVEISVTGEYSDSVSKDVDVTLGSGAGIDMYDTDDADEIMQWLVDQGVEFESERSMAFNRCYVQYVLIDGDMTEEELLDRAAGWTDEDIAFKLQFIDR